MKTKSLRWKVSALATALALGLWGSNAAALSLGRIAVQSALGETLRAEIDLLDINAEEANSIKTAIAMPEAFKAAGLEYNPALSGVQATLEKHADGRYYIRLSSDKTINEPFVDLILEVNWATGRIVRDYTMLFDPAKLAPAATAAPSPAQIPPPAAKQAAAPVSASGAAAVQVKSGDTASQIALAIKPVHISLDQMLVAMLRENPEAFMGGNVNRMKAGAVLNVPASEKAGATSTEQASQIILAQSKDFNEFRRKLAGGAPQIKLETANRQASGRVEAQVDEKKNVSTTPDILTLSKGTAQGKTTEDQLAKERRAKASTERADEIARNINDLKKLGESTNAALPATTAKTRSAAPASAVGLPIAPPVAQTASDSPAEASSAAKLPISVPPTASGLVDQLLKNPWTPWGAAGLLALLAALGLYRIKQRKNAAPGDSIFLESHAQPESFFGASGGQSVETHEEIAPASSMVYSPSQLDAVAEVDPIAEADVYLAYGRDLQAEDILKEALRTNPERLAIHQKLLAIYAKRRDIKAFEAIATLAYKVTNGKGLGWNSVCELGLGIDPSNPLYQPDRQATELTGTSMDSASPELSITPEAPAPVAPPAEGHAAEKSVDLDLNLDFSLDEAPAGDIPATSPSALTAEPTSEETPKVEKLTDALEFSLPNLELTGSAQDLPALDTEEFREQAAASFGATSPAPLTDAKPENATRPPFEMLEFDLGALSLDLTDTAEPVRASTHEEHDDPQATKLALAEEFRTIGDEEGARALLEEVLAEASGEMKIKAQNALNNLHAS